MTSVDRDLLRALAATDAARPVPPGADFTPERLERAAVRRLRRRAVGAVAAVALVATLLARAGQRRADDDERSGSMAIAADLDRLQRSLQAWHTADADRAAAEHDQRLRLVAAAHVRLELAAARSAGLVAKQPAETPR